MTNNFPSTRRDFIKTSAVLGGALLTPSFLRGESTDGGIAPHKVLRVGLIGCGGRGSGAAGQALMADANVELTAMGDVFEEQLNTSLKALQKANPEKVRVDDAKKFIGLDAFQKVIDSGVDVVILATPPAFRPQHLKAAIAANKHVFCEKPVATDAPGIRSVLETVEEAKRKKLALVAGFCWRYHPPSQALFKKVLDGEIGDVLTVYGTYYTGAVKSMPPESERKPTETDLEWQLRNWYNFSWLSGDGLVEQAVHAVDWMCWAMNDVPPVKAIAVGGRQVPARGGNLFDHFEVNYEYATGARGFIGSRQIPGCANNNSATIFGTKGRGYELGFGGAPHIKAATDWKYEGAHADMYQVEHNEMFASIRSGNPINNGMRLAYSTLTAIMGRMAAYTGQEVTWDMALNSKHVMVPENMTWDMKLPVAPTPKPGETKFV